MPPTHRPFVSALLSPGYYLFCIAISITTPHLAAGQHIPGGMDGGMGGGMSRGEGSRRHGAHTGQAQSDADRRNAAADSAREQRGFAQFVLDHAQELTLTPQQRLSLDSINTALHASADTIRPQLDSLRAEHARFLRTLTNPGVPHTAGDTLSTIQRDSIIRRRNQIGTVLASLRTLEQDTRTRTLAVLSPQQRQHVATLEHSPHGNE